MNSITLNNIGKKFSGQWIFNDISFEAKQGDAVAITGYNGSGKSTLLQIISGYFTPSNGRIEYLFNNKEVSTENIYQHITFSAPYMELIEEFTLKEMIFFYLKFKLCSNKLTADKIIETTGIDFPNDKPLKYFSSGMKQRVKLTLALMTDNPFVLLDEPLTNLDQNAAEWYRRMTIHYRENKILLISSNRLQEETGFCNKLINLENFKRN